MTNRNRSKEKEKQISGRRNEGGDVLVPATARGEATRRKILDAAEEVFGEFGYYEASISEITRRAGVAQGTYYIYFHSKREIFAGLVEDIGERLRADLRTAIADATNRVEIEKRGFHAFFQFVARHRRIYHIVQEAERVAPEAFYAYYHKISQGYIRGLKEAMDEGDIRMLDPEAIAYTLMGIGHFVALRWLIWPQDHGASVQLPESVFAAVMDFIAGGLTASPPDF
ncbi:TetR family transcriptional regulator [Reticulibacter mediterranei]|uniref:TetR family transcriptional regulator n=1 Tax=Reticulibacter mediterranei TaxID=2778369 RepID=A0A8J3IQC6_9CHLR|nr:TetR/AcrR family transcriptional regulator [Reticulibacter mediterranei]GHP00020.1 TetR family transcriptional regulator [Reticulibacter mediterranei]